MFALLEKARTLETKYRLLDPTSMGRDDKYTTYSPYAICATLQDGHKKLIADSDWPALVSKLPESNSAPTVTNEDQSNVFNGVIRQTIPDVLCLTKNVLQTTIQVQKQYRNRHVSPQ